MLVLLAFAAFFAVPLIWLVLATTKTGYQLVSENPLAVGSFHNVAVAWRALDGFNDHIYRRWFANSIYYALSGTAVAIATGLPAGYGLAVGTFPGRRLVLALTLVTMLVPAAALVLPIFLELSRAGLLGHSAAVILPFAFFPFGVYISYLYYSTAVPPSLLGRSPPRWVQRVAGVPPGRASRSPARSSGWSSSSASRPTGAASSCHSSRSPTRGSTTIQVGLTDVLTTASQPEIALATLIAAVPLAIVFVLCQRTLRYGLFGGMLKE